MVASDSAHLAHEGPTIRSVGPEIYPVNLLIIQPTPFCNINCDYCYLPNRHVTGRLAIETVERIFRNLFGSSLLGEEVTVVWHAGEPLVLPVSYYEAVFAKIRELNVTTCCVRHAIQTNGMLIDQPWCDFINANNVNIGVSLDGPALIHDAHRKTRSGGGTHADVMRGVALLQQNQIRFHAIAVVTCESLDFPDEVFGFFLDHKIREVGFNIDEIEGENPMSSLQEVEQRYRKFMKRIFELAKTATGAIRIREFDRAAQLIRRVSPMVTRAGRTFPFNTQTFPFSILNVDFEGNFSTFSPELLGHTIPPYGSFALANVFSSTFEDASLTGRFEAINRDIEAGVELCRSSCQYFNLCGGGAPANKHFEHGTFRSAETMYCRYVIQVPIDIVLDDLEKSIERP